MLPTMDYTNPRGVEYDLTLEFSSQIVYSTTRPPYDRLLKAASYKDAGPLGSSRRRKDQWQ